MEKTVAGECGWRTMVEKEEEEKLQATRRNITLAWVKVTTLLKSDQHSKTSVSTPIFA